MEIGADTKIAEDILKNAPVGDSFIKKLSLLGDKYLPGLVFSYTVWFSVFLY